MNEMLKILNTIEYYRLLNNVDMRKELQFLLLTYLLVNHALLDFVCARAHTNIRIYGLTPIFRSIRCTPLIFTI